MRECDAYDVSFLCLHVCGFVDGYSHIIVREVPLEIIAKAEFTKFVPREGSCIKKMMWLRVTLAYCTCD